MLEEVYFVSKGQLASSLGVFAGRTAEMLSSSIAVKSWLGKLQGVGRLHALSCQRSVGDAHITGVFIYF